MTQTYYWHKAEHVQDHLREMGSKVAVPVDRDHRMSESMTPGPSPYRHATGFGRALVLATGEVFEFTDFNTEKLRRPAGDNVSEHGPFDPEVDVLVLHTISGEVPNHFNRRLDPSQRTMVETAFRKYSLPVSSTINFAAAPATSTRLRAEPR
jgi:hypothetical protein